MVKNGYGRHRTALQVLSSKLCFCHYKSDWPTLCVGAISSLFRLAKEYPGDLSQSDKRTIEHIQRQKALSRDDLETVNARMKQPKYLSLND